MRQGDAPARGAADERMDPKKTRSLPVRFFFAFGLAIAVLSTAWGFAGIEGELRLRDQGVALNEADLALDSATASRSHLGEALRVAAFGGAVAEDGVDRVQNLALSFASEALEEFERRVAALTADGDSPQSLATTSAGYIAAGDTFVAALERGDVATADAVFSQQLDPAFAALSNELAGIRSVRLSPFTESRGMVYALSLVTRFLLAIAVPLLAIVGLVDAMRRRAKHRELEIELNAQRDVTKTKDEFIANVSHELRTPLTIVSGFASVLEEDTSLPDHIADAVAYIARESDELTRMVEDLLTAARADAGALKIRMEQVPVRDATQAALAVLADDGDSARVDLERAYVYADPFRLRQVIRNLLSNARRHGGSGLSVTGKVEGSHYVLRVADDGPGVGAEIESTIFDRFVHGPSDNLLMGSIGLGLAIVKSLVEKMNGTISYERIDGWTHFAISLPLWVDGRAYSVDDADLHDAAGRS